MLAIESQIQQVKKRDGRVVRFEPSKITEAIDRSCSKTRKFIPSGNDP